MASRYSPLAPACPGKLSSKSKIFSSATSSHHHRHHNPQISLATAGWVVESMAACNGILAVQQVRPHHHKIWYTFGIFIYLVLYIAGTFGLVYTAHFMHQKHQ